MKITAREPDAAQVQAAQVEATRGRSLIERLRGPQTEEPIVTRVVDGETLYIKRLDWAEVQRCKLLIPRDKTGVLDLRTRDHMEGIAIAMIATALVVGVPEDTEKQNDDGTTKAPFDFTPLFTNAEAAELADETSDAAVAFVNQLVNAIVEVNPALLPNFPAAPSKK